jgi:hypothetical protein
MAEGFEVPGAGSARKALADVSSRKRRLQSNLMLRMLAIDREIATAVIGMWSEFLTSNADREKTQFERLAEYLGFRIKEVGSTLEIGLLMFGCRIPLTDHEQQICFELGKPAWTALALSNDLFSWEKEHRSATLSRKSYISNALFIIMQEHAMGLDKAKEMCRRLIRENIDKYLQDLQHVKESNKYADNIVRLLDALLYVVSGNIVWSASCPRYHQDVQFSEQQIEWMKHGIPKYLLREKLVPARKQPAEYGNGVCKGTNGVNMSGGKNTSDSSGTTEAIGANGANRTKRRKYAHASTTEEEKLANRNGVPIASKISCEAVSSAPQSQSRPLQEILKDHHLAPLTSDVCIPCPFRFSIFPLLQRAYYSY